MSRDFDTLDNQATTPGDDENRLLANRYRIVRKLGEGGMGLVYLAEDTELGTSVAIKFIPPQLAGNARAVKNLKREAATAMQLSHSNIVRLHDLHTDGHQKFLVMEHIEGRTLDALLAEREDDKLSLEELLPIAEQIAASLDYAHGQGVLHRDLKPSNIMVASDGSVKLLDFGIAREMKDSFTRVTGQETSGTLPYMSPEQLMGEQPTPSMDIYSFAAVLYECLSGHPPFHMGDIPQQIRLREATPIDNLPEHLNDALLLSLSKETVKRPKNAVALVSCLRGSKRAIAPPGSDKLVGNGALSQDVCFDIDECIRALKLEKETKTYLEKVAVQHLAQWKQAADFGWPEGQYLLARCHQLGLGVTEDKAEAVKWYRGAVEQGFALAQYNLGVCYANGEGVTEDRAEAVTWFRRAAEQGLQIAQYALGICYDDGFGVGLDKATAIYWFKKAAQGGHEGAKEQLGRLREKW